MSDAELEFLVRAGVPVGAPRPPPELLPDDDELRRGVLWLGSEARPRDLAPHVAWLSAFQHHWPTRFRALFGVPGEQLLADLRRELTDQNRYLKLRRIAVENLSGVL